MKTLLFVLLLIAGSAHASGVEFTARDGWIRAAPPAARALAGYVSLGNTADTPLRIVDASSAAFEAVVFHQSYEEDGMARMRAVEVLEVPPGGSLELAPGGLHLMLLRPTRPIADGANIIVDLLTEAGDPLPVVLKVRRAEASSDEDHSHH